MGRIKYNAECLGGKVAILMSVYSNDRLQYLKQSVDSLLAQTYDDIEIHISVDGRVSDDIYGYLKKLHTYDNLFVYYDDINQGLAYRLNQMLINIKDDKNIGYVARMDADDISLPERISKQVCFFKSNTKVAVLGTDVTEIDDSNNCVFDKSMASQHEVILKQIIKRCPLNHPTVMFNLNVISISDIEYNHNLKNTQDYFLWVDLLGKGYIFSNLNESLLKFRISSDFFKRRGKKKILNELRSRFYAMKVLNCFNFGNLIHIFMLFTLRVSPQNIQMFIYKRFR